MNARITASTTHRHDLAGLSHAALLAGTRQLVAQANHGLAALLAQLAEVEARGLHRLGACAGLYTCAEELGDADQQIAHERLLFRRRLPEMLEVRVHVVEAGQGKPAQHAPLDGGRLVDAQVEPQLSLATAREP